MLSKVEIERIRSHWNNDAIFLGEPDAERDVNAVPEWLQYMYVESDDVARITAGGVRIVVGRKGSGKSACRIAARERFKTKPTKSTPYALEASADELIASYQSEFGGLVKMGVTPVTTWHKAFAYHILKALATDLAGSPLVAQTQVALRKWAIDEGFAAKDFGERVVDAARRFVPQIRKQISPAPKAKPPTDQQVADILRGKNMTLYVDDFDALYDPRSAAASIQQIRAALEAADRLTGSYNGPNVTLLMREDLWLQCRHGWNYLDKVSGVVDLSWSSNYLRSFVDRRLRWAAGIALNKYIDERVPFSQLWETFFPKRITLQNGTASEGFNYILRRTLYTPRDLQKFLIRVADLVKGWPATADDLIAAEHTYSRDRMEYLVNEFTSLCTGLATCLHSFATKTMEMKASDLFKHLKGLLTSGSVRLSDAASDGEDEELSLAKFLFRIGFLEVRYPEGDRFEVRDALRYPDYWRALPGDDSVKWAVRSTFYRVLQSHRVRYNPEMAKPQSRTKGRRTRE